VKLFDRAVLSRGEDKDLASVVWETGLAALQAAAMEVP
jgi:hypothetical protein